MDPLRTTSYIGLVAYIWDWASQLNAEYEFLWKHRWRNPSPAQGLYFVTRYPTFLCHAGHLTMIIITDKHSPDVPEHLCRYWFLYSIVTVAWNYELLFMNLMLKVYALHKCNPKIILLSVFLACVIIGNVVVSWLVFLPAFAYTPNCMPLMKEPSAAILFATILGLIVLAVPVYLTLSRGAQIQNVSTQRRIIDLVCGLRREGVASWSMLSILSVPIISIFLHSETQAAPVLHLSYPPMTTLIPIMCCHLILRTRQYEPDLSGECRRTLSSPGNPSIELDVYESTRTSEREVSDMSESVTTGQAVT